MNVWIEPKSLEAGDTIAIVSPAGAINPAYVERASALLEEAGFNVEIMPNALGRNGTYSATAGARFADLAQAWLSPEIRAIICSRGGYGAVHLLQGFSELPLRENAKWLVGFSDISALHAVLSANGIQSIHGPMAKYIGQNDEQLEQLLEMMQGRKKGLEWESDHRNKSGNSTGRLVGGNLAVLTGLMGTPFDIFNHGDILILEDIAEPIYKVERMMWQLRLAGVLQRAKGIIFGQFILWERDANYADMYDMLADMLAPYNIPIAYNAPIGHNGTSLPWIEGAQVSLHVDDSGSKLRYLQ